MPCNPNIGGSSKGHLVREVDALGGEMGKNIDKTYIQSKMLNKSKGPAVHSLRAQADKAEYTRQMRMTMENTEHLTLRQAEVTELLFEGSEAWQNEEKTVIDDIVSYDIDEEKINVFQGKNRQKIRGVRTRSGASYYAKCVILCTGVYLKARCIYGDVVNYTGPNGLSSADYLSDSMLNVGIPLRRFKTGTPARIAGNTIDYSKMEEQFGDERVVPFSFSTNPEDVQIEQKSCWLTYTNEKTHEILSLIHISEPTRPY